MTQNKGVDAVERALTILNCFSAERASLSLAELAESTGLYKSTILRLLNSLQRFEHIDRSEDGRYRLGPTTWRLGTVFRSGFLVEELLRPELKRLSEESQETASFYVRHGETRVCLYRSEPSRAIRHSIAEGLALPLDASASAQVLHAFSGGSTESQAKSQGYAVSLGQRDPEVAAIAVPIYLPTGEFAGALTVSGLIHRFDTKQQKKLLIALRNSQARLLET